jgi:23S rRNA G2445 N2-methylase RlmL
MGVAPVRTDQGIEDGQHVATVLNHAGKDATKLRLAFRILMPLGEHRCRDFDVAAELFRGMSAQEQTVKEGRFALRKSEIRNHLGRKHGCNRGHSENAVYPKLCPRQVGRQFRCHVAVKTAQDFGCNGTGLDRF